MGRAKQVEARSWTVPGAAARAPGARGAAARGAAARGAAARGALLPLLLLVLGGSGCAQGTVDDSLASSGTSGGSGAGANGVDAASSTGSSGASGSSGEPGSTGSSGQGGAGAGDDATTGDDSAASDAGDDANDLSDAAATGAYVCQTALTPAPVCDQKHAYCLCTKDDECNSKGTNLGNPGGCHGQQCTGFGNCTGGQVADSAGCGIVGTLCNLPGALNACPTGTACETNQQAQRANCGGANQCCWCTSDSACPVSGKCVDDPAVKQCGDAGSGCTGTGTNWDGMHCELASPGIPMCTQH